MSQPSKKAIVCFDGLNEEQLLLISPDMPMLADLLKSGVTAELDSSPFSDAQPIWAEILTGEPWHRNGCAGYAKPTRTLNSLQIITERDLSCPIRLFNDSFEQSNILINMPLVQPLEGRRIWLSDGSTPSLLNVSPFLANDPPFKNYNPRPIVSMGAALSDCQDSIIKFIESELVRLQCAQALLRQKNWQFFLYRTGVFDSLSHLLGAQFLHQKHLAITPKLKKLLTEIDNVLAPPLMQAQEKVIFSSFSHVQCRGFFSLNTALERAKLLARSKVVSRASDLRLSALAAAQSLSEQETEPITVTRTMEYFPQKTLCASPVRGTIYLNSQNRFDDGGKLDEAGVVREEDRIARFFESVTSLNYRNAKLLKNPEPHLGGPNFVFQIDGFELLESLQGKNQEYDVPLSTHIPRGFVWSTKINGNAKYRSLDLVDAI